MKSREVLALFNRGRISRLALARADISRVSLSAEIQTNWRPRALGSMTLRPGTAFRGATRDNARGVLIPFAASVADVALIEVTAGAVRFRPDGGAPLARPAVTAAIVNGEFATDLDGWSDDDEPGATSTQIDGVMQLAGTGFASAIRRQTVSIANIGLRHALRIHVRRGPVLLRVGTGAGLDNVVRQTVLRTGVHSIGFLPGADVIVELSNPRRFPAQVESIAIEAAGAVELPHPWSAADRLRSLRWQQVGDVIFCACDGISPRRIERREGESWSVAVYEPEDGPFLAENTEPVRITPSAITGSVSLTASRRIFAEPMVGALLRMSSPGQMVTALLSEEGAFSDPIRVLGVGATRDFTVTRGGTWSGTLSLQRSLGDVGSWITVATWTGNGSIKFSDGLDNADAYYRIGFAASQYSSGLASVTLDHPNGSITGVVRLTQLVSGVEMNGVVVKALGGTGATEIWAEGAWSNKSGWPSAVALYEGRLWWAGRSRIWASVSDAFESFDPAFEGDAGPIARFVSEGASDRAHWLLPMQRLVLGSDGAERSIRSTSFDEPVTPSNFNVKDASTQGSAAIAAVRADKRGFFVQRSGRRVYEMAYDIQENDYGATDLTALVPEICEAGATRIAVQRQPETRLHVVRASGAPAVMVRDPAEDVLAWVDDETDGDVEDVAVLPGVIEDRVFWIARRTVGGVAVRHVEEMAREDQCRGGPLSRLADDHVIHEGGATATIGGLGHLEGRSVVAWGDGRDLGAFTVVGGAVTLPVAVSAACVGLPYEARYRSAKLAAQTALGLSLTQRSRIDHVGLVLADAHPRGLEFGPDFATMDGMPGVEDGAGVDAAAMRETYDEDMIEFPGEWGTDSRLCLRARAPRPVTVLAAVLHVDRQDKG